MNFSYENQGHITYLSYAMAADDVIDTMSLGMITNNKIHGLAPSIFTQMDTTKYIKYNVSAKISVQQFFSGAVAKKHLLGVFDGIISAIIVAEDYMIDINSIVLDLNYIFADVSTCEVSLICLPIQTNSENVNLNTFFKNIMFSTQFDQSENCDYVAKIINYLNSSPVFSLEDFRALLDSLNGTTNVTPAVSSVQQNVVQQEKIFSKAEQHVPTSQIPEKQPVVTGTVPVQPVAQQVQTPVPPVSQQIKTPPTATKKDNNLPPVPPKKEETAATKKKGGFFGLFSASDKNSEKAEKKVPQSSKVNMSVPTPSSSGGFAIPGQKVPVQSSGGFAIPGQKVPVQSVAPANNNPTQPAVSEKKETDTVAKAQPVAQKPVSQQPAYQPPVVPQSQTMNFGETTVLGVGGAIGETTVLGATTATVQENPHLIRTKNNEKINLNKPVFRIGKEKSYVDYFIGDNTAISRSHANFITRDGEYFVTDTNSTNHTYVNGMMIQSNVETKITHGDKVRLANEDFEFKLY